MCRGKNKTPKTNHRPRPQDLTDSLLLAVLSVGAAAPQKRDTFHAESPS